MIRSISVPPTPTSVTAPARAAAGPSANPWTPDTDLGTLKYVRESGEVKEFLFRPASVNNNRFASFNDAIYAANSRSQAWADIAVGVLQGADGAHYVEPLLNAAELPFLIDGLDFRLDTKPFATRTFANLEAIVGAESWIDLTGDNAVDRGRRALPAG